MSNLHCYIISLQVLAKLPDRVIRKLKELSTSKQTWRDDRLQTIKRQPSQAQLEPSLALQRTRSKISDAETSPERKLLQEIRIKEGIMTTWEGKEIPLASSPLNRKESSIVPSSQGLLKTERPRRLRMATTLANLEQADYSFQRKELTSQSGKIERFRREVQRSMTLTRLNFFPTPLRTPKKTSSRVFEEPLLSSYREMTVEDKNSSYVALAVDTQCSLEEDEDFEFNFVTKTSKNPRKQALKKKLEVVTQASSRDLKSRCQSRDIKENKDIKETSEIPEAKYIPQTAMTRSHMKSLTISSVHPSKLKEKFVSLTSRGKSEYFYKKRTHNETEPSYGLTIRSCVPIEDSVSNSLKSFQDYKLSPTKVPSISISATRATNGFYSSSLPKFKEATAILKKKLSSPIIKAMKA